MLAPALRADAGAVEWPCALMMTVAQEQRLLRALAPLTEPPSMRKLAWQLSRRDRELVGAIGERLGVTTQQAFSLRRGMLKCLMGMAPFFALTGNSHAKGRLIAGAFEVAVERFVRARLPPATVMTTEAQRKAAAQAEGRPCGPTPDLTFDPPICVNGGSVAWIDAKMFYASFEHRHQMPESGLHATAAKYNRAFGPGAFVFGSGFCDGLAACVPALLLDATPLEMAHIDAVIESSSTEVDVQLVPMRIALGLRAGAEAPSASIESGIAEVATRLESMRVALGLAEAGADSPAEVDRRAPSSAAHRTHAWNPLIRCKSVGVVAEAVCRRSTTASSPSCRATRTTARSSSCASPKRWITCRASE